MKGGVKGGVKGGEGRGGEGRGVAAGLPTALGALKLDDKHFWVVLLQPDPELSALTLIVQVALVQL